MKCSNCQTEQNPNFKYCSNCGAELNPIQNTSMPQSQYKSKSNIKTFIGIILIGVIFFGITRTCSNSDNTYSKKLNLKPDQITYLEDLQKQDYISIEADLNKVYIDPLLWLQMDAKLKEDFSASLAIYCGNKKGTELYWVEIYDKQSGKKLAKYSQSWGFDVY